MNILETIWEEVFMKRWRLFFGTFIVTYTVLKLLTGCTSEGGIDPAGVDAVMRGVNDTYRNYDHSAHPERYPTGYAPPQPYQPTPVYYP